MSENARASEFRLRFEGRLADHSEIPASDLTQALEGMQRAVHLLAMEQEGTPVRLRERVTASLAERYTLLCSPLRPGSVAVAARIADLRGDTVAAENIEAVERRFRAISEAVGAGNVEQVLRLVPDRTRRKRLLEALRSMIPRKGSGIRLSLLNGDGTPFFESEAVERGVERAMAFGVPEEGVAVVTGRLSKIDFDAHELTLVYPVNDRPLRCHYTESVEDLLFDQRRDLIQVTGRVIRDQDDNPMEIHDVEDIREVDLSPFYVSSFGHNGTTLLLRDGQPLALEPVLEETQQLMCIKHDDLGIDVFAHTREELAEALDAQVAFLWATYAKGNPDEMTGRARALAERLRGLLTESGAHAEGQA